MLIVLSYAQAQDHPRSFHFTPPDEKLLREANEIDEQYEEKGLVLHEPHAQELVNGIGNRLTGGAPPPERVQYRFRILRDPMVNAFALPNGSVYIEAGLIAAMENEAQLAAIMAHEITHAANRHSYYQNRSMRKKAVTMDIIALAAGNVPLGAAFGYSIAVASQISQVLIVSSVYGYSRELEDEADTDGYRRLVAAGYEGKAMAQAFQVLDERLEFEPNEPFWRTHPKLKARIEKAGKLAGVDEAKHADPAGANAYLAQVSEVVRYNAALDLDSRRARTAVARSERLVAWNSNPANQTLLADAYRSLGAKTPKPDAAETTQSGKEIARKHRLKFTAEEEQRALLATDTGKSTLQANQSQAEKLYLAAIAGDSHLADPHRGLGMLYQDQGRYTEAARQYRTYLDLCPPSAIDRLRIERRLEASIKAETEKP